jgi:hypothetical protein
MSGSYFGGKNAFCPLCGTSLANAKGISEVAGDGIKTYFYD